MTTPELLREAAKALDDGDNPLEAGFLVKHGASLSQARALAGLLAAGARMAADSMDGRAALPGGEEHRA